MTILTLFTFDCYFVSEQVQITEVTIAHLVSVVAPSHRQVCKMWTIDRLVRTCMPSPLTGHIPVNIFNPGDR